MGWKLGWVVTISSVNQSTDGIARTVDITYCNATQLSIKDGKLTGPSQTVKRRVDQLVRVDSALEGLTIEACVNKHNYMYYT